MNKKILLITIFALSLNYLLCELPQDPRLDYNRARIDITIDTINNLDKKIEKSVGDTILFGFHPHLPNLIDSFAVSFGDDTIMTFTVDKKNNKDTLNTPFVFLTSGEKIISVEMFFTNNTSRKVDSVAIFNILNIKPKFVTKMPDSTYTLRDGASLNIPIKVKDTEKDTVTLHLSKIEMPESSKVEMVGDSIISLSVPLNVRGKYIIGVSAFDGKDSSEALITIIVIDSTVPAAPVFKSPSIVNTSTPTWQWESGGNGGCGIFRVSLDDINIANRGTEIKTTEYKHPSSLSEGKHTLFVQERDSAGNWSEISSWEIIVDLTPAESPIVRGESPTNNLRPTWKWSSSGSGIAIFRYKLDNPNFTSADTATTDDTSFTPTIDLSEGSHTLYVQELDEAENWSKSGSFTIVIDTTGPTPPTVTGETPTSNSRPEWSWHSNGGGKHYFRCSLDTNYFNDSSFYTTATRYIPPASLKEGEHTLYVQEQDSAGNWSAAGHFTISIDVTPPQKPIITAQDITNDMTPEWKWRSSGNGAGLYRYRLDNEDLLNVAPTKDTVFVPPTNLSEGPHTLYVQEKDSTENWSEVAYKVVIIDTTPPSEPSLSGPEITNSLKPQWTWTEAKGGNGNYRIKIDTKDMDNGIILSSVLSFTPDSNLTEGTHWFFIQAGDAAGNWSQLDSFKTIIDITPPLKPVISGVKVTNSLRPSWSWSSGGQNGCGIYRYKLDNPELSDVNETTATIFTPSEDLDTGIHILYVQERDRAGNWSEIAICTTKIDITAPGVPLVTGISPTNNKQPTWIWKSAGGSGEFRHKLDDNDLSSGATETTDTIFTPSTYLSEGYHILYVQEKDSAGNWSESGQFLIVIDLQPPSKPVVSGVTPTNNLKPTWNWSTTESNALFRFKLNSDDFTSGTIESSSITYTPETDLTEGTHTLYIQQRDMAGNWSEVASCSIVIDITSPAPPLVTVNSPTNNSKPTWTWVSGGGGNGMFRLKLDNEDLSQGAIETTNFHYQPSEELPEGSHTLYLQERDAAGNWSTSGSATVLIDITPPSPPVISGPSITNNTKPTWSWTSGGGKGYYMYRLDNENIEGFPTYTTSTEFTPTTSLSEGDHVLYIKEQDDAGNWSAASSFTIEIDITKPATPTFTSGTSTSPSGNTSLTWKWTSGGGGNGKFKFKIDNDLWGNDTAITEYSNNFSEGLHKFYVKERDDAGNYSDSIVSSIYVLPAPSELRVTGNILLCNATLNWKNNSTDYDSIFVYRSLCKEGILCICLPTICPTKIASLTPNTTSFTDTNISNGYDYYYTVRVYKKNVGETSSSTVKFTPSCIELPPIDPLEISKPIEVIQP